MMFKADLKLWLHCTLSTGEVSWVAKRDSSFWRVKSGVIAQDWKNALTGIGTIRSPRLQSQLTLLCLGLNCLVPTAARRGFLRKCFQEFLLMSVSPLEDKEEQWGRWGGRERRGKEKRGSEKNREWERTTDLPLYDNLSLGTLFFTCWQLTLPASNTPKESKAIPLSQPMLQQPL